jgi:SAM-dependent methyltransferase
MGLAMEQSPEKVEFWENLYRTKKTPWDLGQVAPPMKTFLSSPYAVVPGKMAVLGCGRGYECVLFAQKGFEVTGVDFAPSAVAETTQGFADDYVLEHCAFCAIEPSKRRTYAWTIRDLLRPGGKFIALWWLVPDKKGGPPFSVHKSEIFDLFRNHFSLDIAYEPKDSVKDRRGQEFLTVMTKL